MFRFAQAERVARNHAMAQLEASSLGAGRAPLAGFGGPCGVVFAFFGAFGGHVCLLWSVCRCWVGGVGVVGDAPWA